MAQATSKNKAGQSSMSGYWVNPSPPMQPRHAPITQVGVLGWLRNNLFNSIGNTLLTLLAVALIWLAGSAILRWAFAEAYWTPVWVNRKILTVYIYPWERIWGPGAALVFIGLLLGVSASKWGGILRALAIGVAAILLAFAIMPIDPTGRTIVAAGGAAVIVGYLLGYFLSVRGGLLAAGWVLALPISLSLIRGAVWIPFLGQVWTNPAGVVPWNQVGGLLLTLILAAVGIALSFPIGVLLALGRRSDLPAIKWICVAYIELIRGVPLVSLLFMAMLALPLALPAGSPAPENAIRAMVAITAFSAAYMAEVVRGGLQAIPKGQYEAAAALGLGLWTKYTRIIMPQALRAVIPAILSNFISMMKDTSLVALVGLVDFLGAAQTIITQSEWITIPGGISREIYLFTAVVYFILSFGLSSASRRLETQYRIGKN